MKACPSCGADLSKTRLQQLEESDVAMFFKERKDPGEELSEWEYIKDDISEILNGEWNLEFDHPEMSAAWMYLYVLSKTLKNGNISLSTSWRREGKFDLWIVPFEHVFAVDFEPLLRELFENESNEGPDAVKTAMTSLRKMLDLIEREHTE